MRAADPSGRIVRLIRGSGRHADVTVGSPPHPGEARVADHIDDEATAAQVGAEQAAVCDAILALFAERLPVTLDSVAERSGVPVRSIYRRFGDLDAAVAAAQDVRFAEVYELWGRQHPPPPHLLLEERVEVMLEQRFEIERLGRALRFTRQEPNPDHTFDAHVREAFAPELDQLDDDRRRQVGLVVAWALRPRAIRSHLDSHGDDALARDTVRSTVLEALRR